MDLAMRVALAEKESGRPALGERADDPSRRYLLLALLYLLFLTLAEALTVYADTRLGMVAHVALLAGLLANATSTADEPLRRSLLALAVAPLVRITSLSLPLGQLSTTESFLLAGIPMIAAAFATARALHLSHIDIGLVVRAWPLQLVVFLSGFAFGVVEYLVLEPEPLAARFSLGSVWLPILVLTLATGFAEEFTFRGVMQSTLSRTMGKLGIPYLAAVFAVLHLGYRSGLDVLFVFAVGLFFGWVVFKTKSIAGVTLSHSATNVSLFILAPLLLAGPSASATPEAPRPYVTAETQQLRLDAAPAEALLARALTLPVDLNSPSP